MNISRHKPSAKLVISVAILLWLVCGVYFIYSLDKRPKSGTNGEINFSLAVTPTPYPLPTRVLTSPSFLSTILGQVFSKHNRLAVPAWVLENGQRRSGDEHLERYVLNDYLPIDPGWWEKESAQVYKYVSTRMETTLDEKVIVVFLPPEKGNCAPRGTTFHEQPSLIEIFADQATGREQVLAVLAHELGHVFIHQKYKQLSDVALDEGMATWAAGDYWKAWKGVDFDDGVRSFITGKIYLPLSQNNEMHIAYNDAPGCITHRDILLTEYASFIDYLIRSRGLGKLSALYDVPQPAVINGRQVVFPPDYKGVYGLELNQLEDEWQKSLLSR